MTALALSDVVIPENRHRMLDPGSVRRLMESIREVGLLNPITVTSENVLVSGLHRHSACELLGWKEIPVTVVDLDGMRAELAEIDENLVRNELTALERSEHLARRKEIYEALHPETRAGVAGAEAKHGRANDKLSFAEDTAAKTGLSKRTVERDVAVGRDLAPDVREKLRTSPGVADNKRALSALASAPVEEQRKIVARSETEILAAAKEIRQRKTEARRTERLENLAEISKGNTDLGTGTSGQRYPVIYADPPWRYEHCESEARAIENQYPTMDLDAICALPVAEVLATPDAILFLWATSPKLAEALQVMSSWGFTYRTCAVWDKSKIGMGYYFRQRHELLLVGTRGSPPAPPPDARPSSVFVATRGEHSVKPDEFRSAIERMYPTLPRVEMFCRSAPSGWATWGNQAGGEPA